MSLLRKATHANLPVMKVTLWEAGRVEILYPYQKDLPGMMIRFVPSIVSEIHKHIKNTNTQANLTVVQFPGEVDFRGVNFSGSHFKCSISFENRLF